MSKPLIWGTWRLYDLDGERQKHAGISGFLVILQFKAEQPCAWCAGSPPWWSFMCMTYIHTRACPKSHRTSKSCIRAKKTCNSQYASILYCIRREYLQTHQFVTKHVSMPFTHTHTHAHIHTHARASQNSTTANVSSILGRLFGRHLSQWSSYRGTQRNRPTKAIYAKKHAGVLGRVSLLSRSRHRSGNTKFLTHRDWYAASPKERIWSRAVGSWSPSILGCFRGECAAKISTKPWCETEEKVMNNSEVWIPSFKVWRAHCDSILDWSSYFTRWIVIQ